MPTIPYKNAKGERVSGVTTIISGNLGWNTRPLMYWSWNEGMEGRDYRQSSEKAADAGTHAHKLVEAHLRGQETPLSADLPQETLNLAETAFLNFLEWEKSVNFKALHTEIHLVSEAFQYGATPDVIGEINGKMALLDLKAGNGTYPDHLIQIAAYRAVWEELHPDEPLDGGLYLLRIGKDDASFHWHWWAALPEAWEAFKHCLELHKLQKILKKKV